MAKERIAKVVPVKEWHISVKQLLLNDQIAEDRAQENWEHFEDTVDAYSQSVFDEKSPKLSGCEELTETAKLNNFSRIYFKEMMVTMIGKGAEKSQAVLQMCRRALRRYQDFDPFEASEAARDSMLAHKTTWKYLEALLDCNKGPGSQDIFSMIN